MGLDTLGRIEAHEDRAVTFGSDLITRARNRAEQAGRTIAYPQRDPRAVGGLAPAAA